MLGKCGLFCRVIVAVDLPFTLILINKSWSACLHNDNHFVNDDGVGDGPSDLMI